MELTKECSQCGKTFPKPSSCSLASWTTRKFCSMLCKAESQKGRPAWNKGVKSSLPSQATFIPCRICGKPTKTSGTSKHQLYGRIPCDKPECIEASRKLKNDRISATALRKYASGERVASTDGWKNVSRVSQEEELILPWMTANGFVPQYKFLTGVHTNKLPRMFSLDFALPERKLYIEIDGTVHRLRKERDARRDAMMTERGWTGLRIPSKNVIDNMAHVKKSILAFISEHSG